MECNTCGGEETCIRCFSMGKHEGRRRLEDPGVGRIILKRIFKNWDWAMHWVDLAQNRDR
jgi:hypothetical protein